MTDTPSGSLKGIRVLDLTRILSGPFCTAILADHGAEVIKVERPGRGDDTRGFGPPFVGGQSAYFMSINRNKRSLVVDLKKPEGVALVKKLALVSDVVIENFRPGTAARLGLGADQLRAENPALIYCSISGFGQTGPWRNKPGYDLAVQGLSGLQSITGQADGPPTKVGTSIADIVTGLYAAQGILLALVNRGRTGKGERVDVAMMDSVVSLLTYHAGNYFATGQIPTRAGNRHPNITPYETFKASDGYFNVAVGNDRMWASFCKLVERPALATDERFETNAARLKHREALFELLSEIFVKAPMASWISRLEGAGIPCGPIHDVREVLEHETTRARKMVVGLDHPAAGDIRVTGVPVKLTEAPGSVHSPPPMLGEHTDEVLGDILGFSKQKLTELRNLGIIA